MWRGRSEPKRSPPSEPRRRPSPSSSFLPPDLNPISPSTPRASTGAVRPDRRKSAIRWPPIWFQCASAGDRAGRLAGSGAQSGSTKVALFLLSAALFLLSAAQSGPIPPIRGQRRPRRRRRHAQGRRGRRPPGRRPPRPVDVERRQRHPGRRARRRPHRPRPPPLTVRRPGPGAWPPSAGPVHRATIRRRSPRRSGRGPRHRKTTMPAASPRPVAVRGR